LPTLLVPARLTRHPLAAPLSGAVKQIEGAARKLSGSQGRDRAAAYSGFNDILAAVQQIEGARSAAAAISIPCSGDPDAAFQCCQDLVPVLAGMSQSLQAVRWLHDDDTQVVIYTIQVATATLSSWKPAPSQAINPGSRAALRGF